MLFRSEGDVRINGNFVGDIRVDGHITIGSGGSIIGNICANRVDISGSCKGDIIASSLIHLLGSAVLEGNIQSEIVVIDEYAKFKGTCKTGTVKTAPVKVDNNHDNKVPVSVPVDIDELMGVEKDMIRVDDVQLRDKYAKSLAQLVDGTPKK